MLEQAFHERLLVASGFQVGRHTVGLTPQVRVFIIRAMQDTTVALLNVRKQQIQDIDIEL